MNSPIVLYIIQVLLSLPCVLISLTFHEYAHAFAAYKLGDPTARNLGRLTLNPLKHLDPIGAVCMLLFRFGWAKPVPINSRNFKHMRRDIVIVSVAGPLTNVVLGFIGLFLYHAAHRVLGDSISLNGSFSGKVAYFFTLLLNLFAILNVSFAVFNLLPIPPLDGSRLLTILLPVKWQIAFFKYERYIVIVLMILVWTRILTIPLQFLVTRLLNGMEWIISLLPIW
jgi:Zn-dependent protease